MLPVMKEIISNEGGDEFHAGKSSEPTDEMDVSMDARIRTQKHSRSRRRC
jgi:hypothetical protein